MSKCANCPNDAVYVVADPTASAVEYCRNCLPRHLQARADAGHFALPQPEPEQEPEPEVVPEPTPKRKRSSAQ